MAKRRRGTGTVAPPQRNTAARMGRRPADRRVHGNEPWPLSWWRRLDDGWRLALILLAVQRVVLGVVGFIAVELFGDRDLSGPWSDLMIRGGEPWSLLLSVWQRWDGLWYQRIAEQGYAVGNSTTNFYPLYPLLSKITSLPLGGHLVLAELVVSSACFAVSVWLLYQLTQWLLGAPLADAGAGGSRGSTWVPTLTVLLVVLFPTGFFLVAPFTESVFLATTLASFWFAYRGQWWLAGSMGFLCALTRANGVVILLPLAFMYARERGLWDWIRRRGGHAPNLALFSLGLPVAGAATWQAYITLIVGDTRSSLLWSGLNRFGRRISTLAGQPLPPSQGGPSWVTVWPWDALGASLENISEGFGHVLGTRPGVGPESLFGVELLNLISLLACCALGIIGLRKLPVEYSLFLWPNLFVLLTRKMEFQPLLSTGRYVVVLFPCFMVLALLLVRWRWVWMGWLGAGAVLQLVLFQFFVRWRFVG